MSELVKIRNRNKYPLSFAFKPINRPSIRKGVHYLVFPYNVYPFKYYELELFVTPTPNGWSSIEFGKTYRVTDKITGYWFGEDWETPEKAKKEAIKILRKVKRGKTNYNRALDNIAKFDWNKWQEFVK
jgi:hypothetical protein